MFTTSVISTSLHTETGPTTHGSCALGFLSRSPSHTVSPPFGSPVCFFVSLPEFLSMDLLSGLHWLGALCLVHFLVYCLLSPLTSGLAPFRFPFGLASRPGYHRCSPSCPVKERSLSAISAVRLCLCLALSRFAITQYGCFYPPVPT